VQGTQKFVQLVWKLTYRHTYFVGPQILSYNSQALNLSEKKHITHKQNKQTTQYNTNKEMYILQSPKSNIVHNKIIKHTIQIPKEIM
jgi:hypothetical protein